MEEPASSPTIGGSPWLACVIGDFCGQKVPLRSFVLRPSETRLEGIPGLARPLYALHLSREGCAWASAPIPAVHARSAAPPRRPDTRPSYLLGPNSNSEPRRSALPRALAVFSGCSWPASNCISGGRLLCCATLHGGQRCQSGFEPAEAEAGAIAREACFQCGIGRERFRRQVEDPPTRESLPTAPACGGCR